MNTQDDLALRLLRLTSSEQWTPPVDRLSFVFPKGGAGRFIGGRNEESLSPGAVLVVGGGSDGSLGASKGSELVFWCFSMRLEHFLPLFATREISLLQRVAQRLQSPKVLDASATLSKQCHGWIEEISPQLNLDHRGQLIRVATAILSQEFKEAHSQRTAAFSVEERIVDVFEKLSSDQLLSLTVIELAARFGCGRRHLNRLFHQYFGFSVAGLRMEMRLLKAVSLLRDTSAKIINVAEQCGFNHLGLFNTCFKRRFGVSPGEWRKHAAHDEQSRSSTLGENGACPLHSKGLCPMMGGPVPFVPLRPKSDSLGESNGSTILRGISPGNQNGSVDPAAIGNDKAPGHFVRPG